MDVGLDPPVSALELTGESGRDSREASVMRDKDMVKSSDWARLVRDRGFDS